MNSGAKLSTILILASAVAAGPALAREPDGAARPQANGAARPSANGASSSQTEEKEAGPPFLLNADEVTHDRQLGLIIASGHVEITQEDRTLLADTVTYDENRKTFIATGNVAMHEPNGQVMFADYFQITDDMKEGFARNIRMIMVDNARLAANGSKRENGNVTEFTKGVYSPCALCAKDSSRPPLWQIKAVRIVHDQELQRVEYKDAFLELFGTPVAYSPYFSHPDPTVRRRSGFLAPHYGNSSRLGMMLQTPYYFDLGTDKDATFAPIFLTNDNMVLAGNYRQRLTNGELQTDFSGTHDNQGRDRGHIRGKGRFDIDDTWRWGYDAVRETDRTYMTRYKFPHQQTLTSNLFAEGFRGRNYASATAYSFQETGSTARSEVTPLILPFMRYNYVGNPDDYGAHTTFDTSALSLTRQTGEASHRLSMKGGWQIPYTSPAGDIYTLSTSLEADGYLASEVPDPASAGLTHSGGTGRLFPQVALDWRYPFVASGRTTSQTIQPIAQFIASPIHGNPKKIPNEDSRDINFDDGNLFSLNRFTGVDRVETGPRINYGAEWTAYTLNGAGAEALIGQTYRVHADNPFPPGSGTDRDRSDYVGRLRMSPNEYLDALYRFRADRQSLKMRRNEIGFITGPQALRVDINYAFLDSTTSGNNYPNREEILGTVSSRVTEYWRGQFTGRRAIATGGSAGGMINAGFGLVYEDECLIFNTTLTRDYTHVADASGNTILFHVTFKNLGEVQTGVHE